MSRYGMPYQGSKSRIAEWIVDILPPSHTLVDLFAGGGAIVHCALLSGKWQNIIANDATDTMKVFCAAINGEFDGYAACPARDEWLKYRDTDTALAILHSFGNDKTTYLWGEDLEAVKRPASLMVSAPSVWERYQWYRRFIEALSEYMDNEKQGRIQELQGVENTARLVQLERVTRLQGLQGLQGDYRVVDIPEGATVYADPPYRATANSSRYGAFDFDAFDAWLNGVDFPVYVSEYDAPAGCVEIAAKTRTTSMSATTTDKRIERVFVQERFADTIPPVDLFGFVNEDGEQ